MYTEADALQLARHSFKAFVALIDPSYIFGKWHNLLIAELEQVANVPGSRLCVAVPPRHGKSRLISELFPAWCFGRNPFERQMAISYGASLAAQFGTKVRQLMAEPIYQLIFPWTRIAGDGHGGGGWQMSKTHALNQLAGARMAGLADSYWLDFAGNMPSYTGQYLATGVGGSLTGRPADLGLVDDALKSRQQADSPTYISNLHKFFGADFYSRLEPGARVVVVNTRWGHNDLIGYILENFDGWRYLRLPAICDSEDDPIGRAIGEPLFPEKYDLAALADIRKTVGEKEWQALYQNDPVAGSSACWKQSYAKFSTIGRADCDAIIVSWDCASEAKAEADYSAYTVFGIRRSDGENQLVVLDCGARQIEFTELLAWMQQVDAEWRPRLHLVEKASNGIAALQFLSNQLPMEAWSAHKNKKAEFSFAMEHFEQNKVLFADSLLEAEFGSALLDQLADFPTGKNDDLCISAIQAIRYAQANPALVLTESPIVLMPTRIAKPVPKLSHSSGNLSHPKLKRYG